MISNNPQTYAVADSAVFRFTDDPFGGLSNMSKSFPLKIYGERVRSSEHLYQIMRFPHRPDIQRQVTDAQKPMAAKKLSRQFDEFTRPDWMDVRIQVMRWVIAVKLSQHITTFGTLLKSSGQRLIVEFSRRDTFWGAEPDGDGNLVGSNILGKLLVEARERYLLKNLAELRTVDAAEHLNLRFLGLPIGHLHAGNPKELPNLITSRDIFKLNLTSGHTAGMLAAFCRQLQLSREISSCQQAHALVLELAREIENPGKLHSNNVDRESTALD